MGIKRRTRWVGLVARYAALAPLLILCLLPLVWMFSSSLKSNLEIWAPPAGLFPRKVHLETYSELFQRTQAGGSYLRWLWNSILVTVPVTILSIMVSSIAAYSIARFRFLGRAAFLQTVLIGQMLPAALLVIPLYTMMRTLGLFDTLAGLTVVYLTFTLPFCIWMLIGFFASIPRELEEAAMLDGCSHMQAFTRVVVPLAVPGIAATALYAWLLAWDEFLLARTLLPTLSNWTLNMGLQAYITETQISWNLAMAGGLLMTIPSLLVYLVLQRYLVTVLTGGAVKG